MNLRCWCPLESSVCICGKGIPEPATAVERPVLIAKTQVEKAIAEIVKESVMENDYGQLAHGARWLAEKLGFGKVK